MVKIDKDYTFDGPGGKATLISLFDGLNGFEGDLAAKSVFLKDEKTAYHTYSAYARGADLLATHYNYLDLTPYGRQEAWEDSPEGWPQKPTYG